ncbi:hypothetical protein CANINC_001385 [Pichia inconspicua]|uniref:Quinate/shikimate 5-dehydrogenase/glutamyl-tRNA reductase domain-containing protein n=1 Tax=Pichia inconspicua TaxID=52247 RepID=A0A4T0X3R0_9ASCO|nr:hypothetical protein CANINC_001385 [[Candida] inconspicua]
MLVLKNDVIKNLFSNLDIPGVQDYQNTLLDALREYKTDPSIIPPRIVKSTEFGCTHLFMASTGSTVGMKAITGSKEGFKGITTVLDKKTGYPLGVINGATLTAFRTALCNTLPLVKVFPLDANYESETLVVFGVGDQAIWHIKLAMILYPNRFTRVVISNRTVSKAEQLCNELQLEHKSTKFEAVGLPSGKSDDPLLEIFKTTSVVFTCIPTSQPTITTKLVQQLKKQCFIGAIGSYKPHMTEIEGDVLRKYILEKGGKIVVDSTEHCLHEAGEFIINEINEDSLVEISSLYENGNKNEWIKNQTIVVSKLVGLCIMDVSVGNLCLEKAKNSGNALDILDF